MSTSSILIGAGQRYDRVIGVGGVTVSTDGYLWSNSSEIAQPFPPGMKAQGIATTATGNVFVAISDSGWASTSYDLGTWTNTRLLDNNFTALGISWGRNGDGARPLFAVAGSRIYNDDNTLPGEYEQGDQIAQILINESGSPYTWDQAFTHPYTSSWFHNVRYFDAITINGVSTSAWVAVGHVNGQPDIWYTENINWVGGGNVPDPNTWVQVVIPASFSNRPLYDVAEYQGTLYFSGRGVIINTTDLGNPTWNSSPFFCTVRSSTITASTPPSSTSTVNMNLGGAVTSSPLVDFVSIAASPEGQLVATSSKLLISSNDRTGWSQYSLNGYYFRSAMWFEDHWVVGSYSDLTEYTYFTSTNGMTWIPRNNMVQMYGMYAASTYTSVNMGGGNSTTTVTMQLGEVQHSPYRLSLSAALGSGRNALQSSQRSIIPLSSSFARRS